MGGLINILLIIDIKGRYRYQLNNNINLSNIRD